MRTPLKCRFVKRAVMALAGGVLLVSGYVGSYFAAQWLSGQRIIPRNVPRWRVYAPIELYEWSDLPGSVEFFSLALWFECGGERSLKECRAFAIYYRESV